METKNKSFGKMRIMILFAVIVILSLATINDAYSFSNNSSSVTVDDNSLDADYLTIDVYDGQYSAGKPTCDVTFKIKGDLSPGALPSTADTTFDETYWIRVASEGLEEAYLYGYYTCDQSKNLGVAVKYIEMGLKDSKGSSYTAILYNNAYKGVATSEKDVSTINLSQKDSGETFHYREFQVTTVTVYFYEGVVFSGSDITVPVYRTGYDSCQTVKITDATDVSNFNFYFLTSECSLLG